MINQLHQKHVKEIYRRFEDAVILIPIERGQKRCLMKGWPKISFEATQVGTYIQVLAGKNLGVRLGSESFHVCVIDLDADEYVNTFLALNPGMKGALRTRGARGCSIWLRMSGDYPRLSGLFSGKDRVGEWRADGGQTVIWGTHPDTKQSYSILSEGEILPYTWGDIVWGDMSLVKTKMVSVAEDSSDDILEDSPDLVNRRAVADSVLGEVSWVGFASGYCECPGKHTHTTGDGYKDCMVFVSNKPRLHCFHQSCLEARSAAETQLMKSKTEKKVEDLTGKIFFDGMKYWSASSGKWSASTKDSVKSLLRTQGIDCRIHKGETASEMDFAMCKIESENLIEGALPISFRGDVVNWYGRKYLNTSLLTLVKPEDVATPFLTDYMGGLFANRAQYDSFMTYLAYAYIGCLEGEPRQGQIMFLVGPVQAGKTLLSRKVMGGLFGGFSDPSDYFQGNSNFTAKLFDSYIWSLDDSTPASDPRKKATYSSLMKRVAANKSFQYHEKFQKAFDMEWCGRLVVTLNGDPQSLTALPDMDSSIMDKVMLFSMSNRSFKFPDQSVTERLIREELPGLAKQLIEWVPPAGTVDNNRYKVASYHESALLDQVRQSSDVGIFAEILESFMEAWLVEHQKPEWSGKASELRTAMLASAVADNVREYSNEQFAHRLRKTQQKGLQGYIVSYVATNHRRPWVIRAEGA